LIPRGRFSDLFNSLNLVPVLLVKIKGLESTSLWTGVQFLNICMFRVDDKPVLKYNRSRFSPRVVQACMFKTFNRMSKGTIQSISITAVRNKWNHCRLRNFCTFRIIIFRLLSLIIRYNSYFNPAIGTFVKILLFSKV